MRGCIRGRHAARPYRQLHPTVCDSFELSSDVYAGVFSTEALFAASQTEWEYTPLPVYPAVERDLALVMDESTEAGTVEEDAIRSYAGKSLCGVTVFDVYTGKGVADGKKSVAFRLSFRLPDKTMNDKRGRRGGDENPPPAGEREGHHAAAPERRAKKFARSYCYFVGFVVSCCRWGEMKMKDNASKTIIFSLKDESEKEMHNILQSVYDSLKEKGYNPINQIVGYILSEDPTYITNYNNARARDSQNRPRRAAALTGQKTTSSSEKEGGNIERNQAAFV